MKKVSMAVPTKLETFGPKTLRHDLRLGLKVI
jgi:hypothetical protein